ncbi:hypothetical protein AB0D86_42280 [Streptomyces sp. NPDC048324]|uniref:hypothetical protein n=1 Tax=Streptomyces sp. NPDC048324 TaxID=3157205 RepID=UPI0034220949
MTLFVTDRDCVAATEGCTGCTSPRPGTPGRSGNRRTRPPAASPTPSAPLDPDRTAEDEDTELVAAVAVDGTVR